MVVLYRERAGWVMGVVSLYDQLLWSGQSHGLNIVEEVRAKLMQIRLRGKESKLAS
jgi:hypothetical protein